MSLRELAEQDLATTLEDVAGFGWPVTVTNPAGDSAALIGQSTDVAQIIDPDTGQAVSGRMASVALRASSLDAAALGRPVGVADAGVKPWIVEFDDINGASYKFKVAKTNPDRALGILVCILEPYE